MDEELIQKTAEYVRLKLLHEPSGHDWFHVERVWKTARFLQQREGGDLFVIELAALIHNLKEHNYPHYYGNKARLALHAMMDILEIEESVQDRIITIIEESRFRAAETVRPESVESRIIQDANWLDSLGAIGVARSFASGGALGITMYDPSILTRTVLHNHQYQLKNETTSFNHLIEKSLRVAELLNTETAKHIAEKRIAFIRFFMDQFLLEWNGKDIPLV